METTTLLVRLKQMIDEGCRSDLLSYIKDSEVQILDNRKLFEVVGDTYPGKEDWFQEWIRMTDELESLVSEGKEKSDGH